MPGHCRRPAGGLIAHRNGSLLVADFGSGKIYRIVYKGS
jgi:glucose/arabinose dehydrogenase